MRGGEGEREGRGRGGEGWGEKRGGVEGGVKYVQIIHGCYTSHIQHVCMYIRVCVCVLITLTQHMTVQ